MEKARIDAIYKWAEKKREKYMYEYQNSGNPSSLRTYERYDDICDICAAAERAYSEEDELRRRIHKNQLDQIVRLIDMKRVAPGKVFDYDEVEKMMRRMMI